MNYEFEDSYRELKVGTIVYNEISKKTFKIVNCEKHLFIDDYFTLKLEPIESSVPKIDDELSTENLITKLRFEIDRSKLHDKEQFAFNNIISQLEDSIKAV